MQMNVIFVLSLASLTNGMLRGTGDQTLVTDMRPDVVRKLLGNVEQKWIHTRAMVLSNVTNDDDAFHEMQTSCIKVATAIVAGSEGQRDRVMEYMQDVCTDNKGLCTSFASGIEAVMTDDSEFNRDELHLSQFCRKFWDGVVTGAAQAEAKEEAEKAEEQRKEQEKKAEEERKEQEEAAKKAAEEAEKERVEKLRIQAEEEAKQKAAEEEAKQQAAEVKAYEAQQESKNQTNMSSVAPSSSQAQVNESTVAVSSSNATSPSKEAAQVDSTAEQTIGDSTAMAAATNSTGNNTSIPATVATENKTDSTPIAMIAHTAIKNATAAMKK